MLYKVDRERLRRVVNIFKCAPLSGVACQMPDLGMGMV
jgi:hypothetical protein